MSEGKLVLGQIIDGETRDKYNAMADLYKRMVKYVKGTRLDDVPLEKWESIILTDQKERRAILAEAKAIEKLTTNS